MEEIGIKRKGMGHTLSLTTWPVLLSHLSEVRGQTHPHTGSLRGPRWSHCSCDRMWVWSASLSWNCDPVLSSCTGPVSPGTDVPGPQETAAPASSQSAGFLHGCPRPLPPLVWPDLGPPCLPHDTRTQTAVSVTGETTGYSAGAEEKPGF